MEIKVAPLDRSGTRLQQRMESRQGKADKPKRGGKRRTDCAPQAGKNQPEKITTLTGELEKKGAYLTHRKQRGDSWENEAEFIQSKQ